MEVGMSESRKVTPVILVIPANTAPAAKDCIVGDVHGNCKVFEAVMLERKNPLDRIFVAGDLIDRGKGSVQIIRDIVSNNKEDTKGKIYCVRGNHEDMCLNAIKALIMLTHVHFYSFNKKKFLINLHVLHEMSKTDSGLEIIFSDKVIAAFLKNSILHAKKAFTEYFENIETSEKMNDEEKITYLQTKTNVLDDLDSVYGDLAVLQSSIALHLVNGGQWLLEIYMKELSDKTISAAEGENIKFSDSCDIMLIKNYMESLPYIIHVEGKVPFNIVHADMPINDVEMLKRITDGGWLTDDEKEYAMWARPHENAEIKIKTTGRDEYSILTFSGHTIDGSVRRETNTINLDVAAYARNSTIVVKMPSCGVQVITDHNHPRKVNEAIIRIARETQNHLDRQAYLIRAVKQGSPQILKSVESEQSEKTNKATPKLRK
jgi:hypothetical protein